MAAKNLALLNEIHGGTEAWTVKVKIIRVWKQNFRTSPLILPSIEMVVIDEKGTRIQSTIKHSLMEQYGALPEEGGSVFCQGVQLSNHWAGPQESFDLHPFNDILTLGNDNLYSFDVIGEVVHSLDTHVMNIKEREMRFKCVQLQDENGMKIKCTLWGEHATKLDAFLLNPEINNGRVIMLVQFAKLGKCDRLYITERYVTPNYKGGSKVWIDEDLPAFAEFNERLSSINVAPNTRRFLSSTSVYLSDDYWEQFQFKNIDELMDIKEDTRCIVVGTIINIDTEKGWFYHACSKCTKKVDRLDQPLHNNTDHEGITSFVCGKCGFITDVYPKILVQVRVQDTTGCISLAICDHDVTGYFHKPTSNFITNATNGEHSKMFPAEFNVFLGKRFAWRINVSKYNIEHKSDLYTLYKFSDNVSVIEAILHRATGDKDGSSDVDLQVLNELPSSIELNKEDVVFGTSETAGTASSSGSKKVVEHEDVNDVHKMKVPKLQN